MFLGSNLQYLRRESGGLTQEKLAEQIGVSRQTVSKWESGEAYPELHKLMDLCEIFHCRLDDLLRQDMAARASIYYPVQIVQVAGFRRAQYVIISANPEADSAAYMDSWIQKSGLDQMEGYSPVRIRWGFPYVSAEQKNRFGLRGHVSGCVLPEGFEPADQSVQILSQEAAEYAVTTIRDPFTGDYNRIAQAYHLIFEYLSASGFKKKYSEKILPTFERVYKKGGITYMDVYIHCESGGKVSKTIQLI